MRKIIRRFITFVLLSAFVLFIGSYAFKMSVPTIAQDQYGIYSSHKFDEMPELDVPDDVYITYTYFRNSIATTSTQILAIDLGSWDKVIRFDEAEELYRFSLDVSYKLKYTTYESKLTDEAIEVLLSLDYALGRDIDYSVVKSKRFNPIGYDFYIEETHYSQAFKGTFDGNGFEIKNLYFTGFDSLTESLYEGTEYEVQISYTEYYSMFAYNEGTIKNLGLVNTAMEFTFESTSLYKAANLVGVNRESGIVNHVYVIDHRATALVSGIRMTSSSGEAAGVMFDNYGTFHDAYYVSRVVMNASYGSRFDVQPVLYENHEGGTYEHLAYDNTLYQQTVTVGGSSYNITEPNLYATGLETMVLRSNNTTLGAGWYYFPYENNPTPKYPTVLGLEFVQMPVVLELTDNPLDNVTLNEYYIIENTLDLIAFSKMLDYTREPGLTPFREMNYVVIDHIDMRSVAANSYTTPSVEFSGVFAGLSNEVYIYDLKIVNGISQGVYYSGLFSVLSGAVYNLMFYNASISLTETDNFAGDANYVGLIAGLLDNGIIRNVLVDVVIDLGHATLGEMHVGSIVGQASGLVSSIYSTGEIIPNIDHVYRDDILINPVYHFGGIVGSTGDSQLVLTDVLNEVDIHGLGTSSNQMTVSQSPKLYLGGIIGKVTNTQTANHVLGYLTNKGTLTTHEIISQHQETLYVSGIIGMSSGLSYEMNYTFGYFVNEGELNVINRGSNQVVSAGILISNHSEETEFIHLFNKSDSQFVYYVENGGSITGDFNNLEYTSLVYNIGQGVILSQSKNEADIYIYGDYDFSGVYHSTTNSQSLLRFVRNEGDITYQNQTIQSTRRFAGISLSENIDYSNITYDGTIRVSNVVMQTSGSNKELFVAGITHTLSNGRVIKNSFVSGEITVAGVTSNTVNRTQRNNIYIGGFVNYNQSGNMDPNGTESMPKATIGIINSINSANITSTYSPSVYGITGHANVYAGGLVTFNDGDIQDSANIGDVRFENLSNVDTSNVVFNEASTVGGAVTKYRYGIVIGGVSAAVFSQKSRIYDSSNKGTIIALSKNFARAGGILGIAIYREIEFGNVYTPYSTVNNANIGNSILSNCINYGDISALTISISEYSMNTTTQTMSGGITNNFRFDITMPVDASGYQNSYYSTLSGTSVRLTTRGGTEERPGINAAAGGVIGYGLSVMRRMMNHGQISSTDVAGGVVGATVVILTEYVRIDTAINYGTVRAFNRGTAGSGYSIFNSVDIMDYETIRDGFYAVDDTFIFPNTYSDIRLFPENKRGIGGIFGRLQRAANQYMYGNNDANSTFNFIVNMDPNVDLVGRLDQVYNYYSSLRFFDFRGAVYYSAKKNDTTQAVFTGISYFYDNSNSSGNSLTAYRRERSVSITSRKYEYSYNSSIGQWVRTTYERTMNRTEISIYGRRYQRIGPENPSYENYQEEIVSRPGLPSHSGGGWSLVPSSSVSVGTLSEYKYVSDLPLYNQVWDIESTRSVNWTNDTNVPNGYYLFGITLPVPTITEELIDNQGQYVYDSSFEMQTDPVLQQYIYFAENGNLSPTFVESRPNGMYILSSSSGSTFGSILPANMSFAQLLPLQNQENGNLPTYDVDYESTTKIDPTSDSLYLSLLNDYESLFQTLYSDKSELLDDNESSIYLSENNGSNTKLIYPNIIDPTSVQPVGVITFDLNLATLDFSQGGIAHVDYQIYDALLPNDAVIAKTIEEYYGLPYGSNISSYISSYQQLLEQFVDPDLDDSEKPDLSPVFSHTFDLNSLDLGIVDIGYFTSYSQVSQYFDSFLNDAYVTDYLVRLNVSYNASYTKPYFYSYQINGGSQNTNITSHINNPVSSSLRFNFRDPSHVLPVGTNILELGSDAWDNVTLEYYNPNTSSYVFVDYDDYELSYTPVATSVYHPFSFTVHVNPELRSGLYRIGFNVLPYEDDKDYYTFTKSGSTLADIVYLEHYSSGGIIPSTTNIQTQLNFGYNLDISNTNIDEIIDEDAKAYHSNVAYYTLPFLNEIQISSFSSLTNVTINSMTYSASGYRIYNISYTVTSESGQQSKTYNHQIHERSLSIKDVFRNNNKVVMNQQNPVIVTREALSTSVSVNYGIDGTYSADVYNLEVDNPNAHFIVYPDDEVGISFSVTNNYLVFNIDRLAVAGLYAFEVGYSRQGEGTIDLGTVYISKNQGTNAYLSDIQFAELATETNYAKMYVSDNQGTVDLSSPYLPSIYYAGIDYDHADTNGITNFRVDGQVSNIPLDEYIPYFLNYLPLGATISRKISSGVYSDEVYGVSDPNVYQLAADFTASEGGSELEDVIITYRVTSEDGQNVIYYHITVTDITYNVSYIFDMVYEGNDLRTDLEGIVVVINVRNMTTNLPVGDAIVTTLPQFSQILNYNNTTNLFYMFNHEDYKFRFGRNKSGYFSFNVKVLDPDDYIYDFKIELNGTDELENITDYDIDSSDKGKYYYINSSTKNRTRNFVITIFNAREKDRDYGFTDEDPSW